MRVQIARGSWDGSGAPSISTSFWTINKNLHPRGIKFSNITAGRFAAVNKGWGSSQTAGNLAIYDLDLTNPGNVQGVNYTEGAEVTLPSNDAANSGNGVPAHISWNYNRDEFAVMWRIAGDNVDDNTRLRTYNLTGTTPTARGAEHSPYSSNSNFKRMETVSAGNVIGEFEYMPFSEDLFATYISEKSGGNKSGARGVWSTDPNTGNLTLINHYYEI